MNVQLEILQNGQDQLDEACDFWTIQWNKIFQKLIGSDADLSIFYEQSFFYILRFDGQIGAIMSSAWQETQKISKTDPYYAAWPEALTYLHTIQVSHFQKMGMIAADIERIPKGFKLTHVLVGCGIRFAMQLPGNQAIVSFPRPDTSVYRACVDWGARTPKTGLQMYNAPVNFITVLPNEVHIHPNKNIAQTVDELWQKRKMPDFIPTVAA